MSPINDEATYEIEARGDDMVVTLAGTGEEIAAVDFGPGDLGSEDGLAPRLWRAFSIYAACLSN